MTDEERREYRREYMREWRAKNKERIKEYKREYRAKNKERKRERNRKDYAEKKDLLSKANLKPCPFCGSKQFNFRGQKRDGYRILCMTCGALSGEAITKQYACDAWNERSN